MLAGEFATFFTTKIKTPRKDLLVKEKALIDRAECVSGEAPTMSLAKFSTFTEMKIDDISIVVNYVRVTFVRMISLYVVGYLCNY